MAIRKSIKFGFLLASAVAAVAALLLVGIGEVQAGVAPSPKQQIADTWAFKYLQQNGPEPGQGLGVANEDTDADTAALEDLLGVDDSEPQSAAALVKEYLGSDQFVPVGENTDLFVPDSPADSIEYTLYRYPVDEGEGPVPDFVFGMTLPYDGHSDLEVVDGVATYGGDSYDLAVNARTEPGFQASIVIREADAPERYEFGVDTGIEAEFQEFVENEDGSITLYGKIPILELDENGDLITVPVPVLTINSPVAYDANGVSVPTHFEFDHDTNTLIQVVNHQGFAYPVVADPSIFGFGVVISTGVGLVGIAAPAVVLPFAGYVGYSVLAAKSMTEERFGGFDPDEFADDNTVANAFDHCAFGAIFERGAPTSVAHVTFNFYEAYLDMSNEDVPSALRIPGFNYWDEDDQRETYGSGENRTKLRIDLHGFYVGSAIGLSRWFFTSDDSLGDDCYDQEYVLYDYEDEDDSGYMQYYSKNKNAPLLWNRPLLPASRSGAELE